MQKNSTGTRDGKQGKKVLGQDKRAGSQSKPQITIGLDLGDKTEPEA
jgi:hypothetical protein